MNETIEETENKIKLFSILQLRTSLIPKHITIDSEILIQNFKDKIKEHLKKVKKIDDIELENHIREAYNIWNDRNKIEWIIDTSIISNSGFEIKK